MRLIVLALQSRIYYQIRLYLIKPQLDLLQYLKARTMNRLFQRYKTSKIGIDSSASENSGYQPYIDPYLNPAPQRIVREIPRNGPVTDLSLIDVQCDGWTDGGFTTAPAPIYATVAAGSQGSMISYMARAPSDITKWSPGTSAVWFKVAESGKTSDGKWAASDLLTASNSIYTFTIPKNLKAGRHIIRHEIIALHAAYTYPGAQVYPSCIQVQVTGSGTALPTSFVSFPGAYTASTPFITHSKFSECNSLILDSLLKI
ncbi:hypothetical protein K435DRAFT_783609 [Dendrothele bispora CBS 962.96]|uniref:lytic cellulose monooxygenase (C4-dehydrogenating) n=1 Tax=Dendrothele bispora (strain CBS 962.96) TaxID=1314807 RepID=A0A4S8L8S8_DENBC|nr:hypothetical protein K435DRAFT_783609 [Dendrothele bispora CBS 962.96]